MISLIWAMDENRVIGINNTLPWHLPADLKYFKSKTLHHTIVMGRKTFESMGRALPGRNNVILTKNKEYQTEGCTVVNSIHELSVNSNEEIFVIGGAEIFKEFLPLADKLYVTILHAAFVGDTYFPAIDLSEWVLCEKTQGNIDEKNLYAHDFLVYEKL